MKYFFLIGYYNIHITPLMDELAAIPGNQVTVGLLEPAERYRPGFGWDDTINTDIFKRIYAGELEVTVDFLRGFDVLGVLGIYGDKELYRAVMLTLRFTNAKVCIFSEGLKKKKFVNRTIKRLAVLPINTDRISLFAIGSGCAEDYRAMGGTNWNIYRFGYTVGINPAAPETITPRPQRPVKFISIGQLIERKRVMDIIDAAGLLDNEKAEYSVDVFGDGVQRQELEERITEQKVGRAVNIRGVVKNQHLFTILPEYDCLILSSRYDGWGAVVNEAMQAGLAIILADGVRAKQLLEDNPVGIIYRTGNVRALSAAMAKLINNRLVLNQYRAESLRVIKDYFPATLAARVNAIMRAQIDGAPEPVFENSLKAL